jgi:hypothetical protein
LVRLFKHKAGFATKQFCLWEAVQILHNAEVKAWAVLVSTGLTEVLGGKPGSPLAKRLLNFIIV